MNNEVFIRLQNALDTVKTAGTIAYVGEDWGQLDYFETRPPVKFPCVLFDVGAVSFADRGGGSQQANGTINLRIADYRPLNVSSGSPDSFKALEMYDTLRAVYIAVQGLSDERYFTPLTRKECKRIIRDDGVREFVMAFTFSYVDNDAAIKRWRVAAEPKITVTNKERKSPG